MRKIKPYIYISFSALILFFFIECAKPSEKQLGSSIENISFRDIPGVTEDEIKAIEVLLAQRKSFSFGMMPNTEAYININGEIRGYAALFCEWLSGVFGIPFQLEHFTWANLIEGLKSGTIDFTGTLTASEERLQIYYMTETIAQRTVKYIRLRGSEPLSEIRKTGLPRYALLEGTTTAEKVLNSVSEEFELRYVSEYIDAYELLKNGEIDALIAESTAEAVFDAYGDVTATVFLPLIYTPVSLTTQNPELIPVISIVQKMLENGANKYLGELYNQGYQEYLRHKLLMQFSREELAFIKANPIVPFAAEYDNYPVSFYSIHINEWQGLCFDILKEIESLTGLKFHVAHDKNTEWAELLNKLESGEVFIISELIRTPERENRFLWPENTFWIDQSALISRADYPNINIQDILSVKVGLTKGLAHTELFHRWFPDHKNTIEFESTEAALKALVDGTVDMVMNKNNMLLQLTHYQELPGYKANVVFDNHFESTFGLNKDQPVLCSIIDKALALIDTETISGHWLRRTYDYRLMLTEAQRPWIFGTGFLIIFILIFTTIVSMKSVQKRNMKISFEYANKLSGTLAEITKSPAISAGVLKDAVDIILREGCRTLNASRIGTWLVRKEINALQSLSCYNARTEEFTIQEDFDLLLNTEYTRLLENERLVVTNNVRTSAVWSSLVNGYNPNLCALLDVPIRIDGKWTGVVCVEQDRSAAYTDKREWTIEEQNFASSLADIMALAISGAERRTARDAAETANRAKSAFLANMSHEMRTPMNVVVGLTDLMLDEDDPSVHLKENLKKISTAGNTLLGLINDVLDISKIEAGKLELMPVDYDVPSLLNDIITLNIIRIEEKPITFILDISDDLPCRLFGDDLRVKQIINNLLSNAFKYTQKGTVTLGMNVAFEGQDAWVSVYVSDTGMGIRNEDLKKLFADYGQVDTRSNRLIEGTGLGLSITRRLTEMMDGKIEAESEYGKGTTFRVRFRQSFIQDKAVGKETADNLRNFHYTRKADKKLTRNNLSYARVLVVDDMQTNLDVASGLLRKYKMNVDCVLSGKEAIARIEAAKPAYDAVFMDHMMPEMDGIEATRHIRTIGTKYAMNIPIIALTANAIAGNEQIFLSNNFQAFLTKPINILNLDSVVQKWVRDKTKEQ